MDFKKIIKMFDNTAINEQVGPSATSAVARASGIADPNKIRPGQKITIPTAGGGFATTTVKPGDTLSGIIKQMQGRQDFQVDTRSRAVKPADPITPVPAQTTPGGGPGTQQELARRLGQNAPYTPPGLQSARMAPGQTSAATTPDATAPATNTATLATTPATPDTEIKPDSGFTPAQEKWLGGADRTDPYILSRMRSAVPGAATGSGENLGKGSYFTPQKPAADDKTQAVPTDTGMEMKPLNTQSGNNTTQNFAEEELQDLDEELAEAFNDMLRLSGLQLNEKAPPGAKAERMVKHIKKGYAKDGKLSDKEKSIAFATAWKAHNAGKLDEGVNFVEMMRETEQTLEEMISELHNEITEYKMTGHMGDKLRDAMELHRHSKNKLMGETTDNVVHEDDTLNELARLAGLTEVDLQPKEKSLSQSFKDVVDTYKTGLGMTPDRFTPADPNKPFGPKKEQVKECDDNMQMDQKDTINVSTNMSSDGNKSVNISAQGEKAEELLSMLKLAGMGDKMPRVSDGVDMDHPGAIEIHGTMDADGAEQLARSLRSKSRDEEMMDEGGVPIQQIPPVEPKPGERTWPYSPQPGGSAHADAEGRRVTPRAPAALEEIDKELDEAKKKTRVTKHANTPDEEYQTVASITRQGNDLNREKKQFANMPKAGDNPMATDYMLDEELSALLDSVLVKEVDPRRPPGDTGIADIYTAGKGIAPPSPDEGPINYPKKIQPQQLKATEPSMKNMPLPKTAPEPSMKNMPLPKGQEPRTKPM